MITMNKAALGLALGAVLSMGAIEANACTVAAWSGSTGAVNAASPTGNTAASPKRYSALCGLQTVSGAATFVTDNTPGTEGIYRARFYVFTGASSAAGRVFSATSADDGGGSEVIAVNYNPGAGNFDFIVNGASVGTAPANAGRWHGIEVAFNSGTSFEATVKTTSTANAAANTETTVTAASAPAAATVGSARLGNIDGVAMTTAMNFDEFDSTRSAATEIGFLCRGDANNDGSRTSGDGIVIRNEFFGYSGTPALSQFQPDCNEDGLVNSGDGICVRNIFFLGATQRACTSGI